jgi:integrase/recombinase XerD
MDDKNLQHLVNSNLPIAPALNAWKEILADESKSTHTIKAFSADINLLSKYLAPDYPLKNISTNDLNNFLDWMISSRGVPCSPKTYSRRITSIKSFFKWLFKNKYIDIDPSEKVIQKSVISPLPKVLTSWEIEAVLKAANKMRSDSPPDTRSYLLLKLLLDTAIKKGECLSLSPNHINLDAPDGPFLFIRYTNPKYRYKERKISLSQEWIDAYQEYKEQYQLVDRLFPWSPRRLEYLLEDLGKDAGIPNQLSFVMCRWSSALTDLKNDVEPDKIRQKLGVSKIQWREVYMKLKKLTQGVVQAQMKF